MGDFLQREGIVAISLGHYLACAVDEPHNTSWRAAARRGELHAEISRHRLHAQPTAPTQERVGVRAQTVAGDYHQHLIQPGLEMFSRPYPSVPI
jgi:hypothetical protein